MERGKQHHRHHPSAQPYPSSSYWPEQFPAKTPFTFQDKSQDPTVQTSPVERGRHSSSTYVPPKRCVVPADTERHKKTARPIWVEKSRVDSLHPKKSKSLPYNTHIQDSSPSRHESCGWGYTTSSSSGLPLVLPFAAAKQGKKTGGHKTRHGNEPVAIIIAVCFASP